MSSTPRLQPRLLGVIVVVAIFAVAYRLSPTELAFDEDFAGKVSSSLGFIFLISLFLERAIEVFLSVWRSKGADDLDFQIQTLQSRIQKPDPTTKPAELESLQTQLDAIKKDRVRYSGQSRQIAMWAGLIGGVAISFVGVRILGNIVDTSALMGMQKSSFIMLDVMFTGAVLSGGSEAINKIMKLYNQFMYSTSEQAKARAAASQQQ